MLFYTVFIGITNGTLAVLMDGQTKAHYFPIFILSAWPGIIFRIHLWTKLKKRCNWKRKTTPENLTIIRVIMVLLGRIHLLKMKVWCGTQRYVSVLLIFPDHILLFHNLQMDFCFTLDDFTVFLPSRDPRVTMDQTEQKEESSNGWPLTAWKTLFCISAMYVSPYWWLICLHLVPNCGALHSFWWFSWCF